MTEDIQGWGWLTYAIINFFIFAAGWAVRQISINDLCARVDWQGIEILKLSAIVVEKDKELKLLKECRFHGGTPPPPSPKPSVFGAMLYYQQHNQKITPPVKVGGTWWTADYIRARAAAIL